MPSLNDDEIRTLSTADEKARSVGGDDDQDDQDSDSDDADTSDSDTVDPS